jgi:peptidylprolyl isomerase
MVRVQEGNTVRVHYTALVDDGTVVDSSMGKDPIEFEAGKENYLPHFERAVVGMAIGEKKTTTLPPDKAFGPYRPELATTINKIEFSSRGITPEVGLKLEIPQPGQDPLHARVTEISDSTVHLDANHPLAGHAVTFDIELVEIL